MGSAPGYEDWGVFDSCGYWVGILFSGCANNVAFEFGNTDVVCKTNCTSAKKIDAFNKISVPINCIIIQMNKNDSVFTKSACIGLKFEGYLF